jgi:hypothetical protein
VVAVWILPDWNGRRSIPCSIWRGPDWRYGCYLRQAEKTEKTEKTDTDYVDHSGIIADILRFALERTDALGG